MFISTPFSNLSDSYYILPLTYVLVKTSQPYKHVQRDRGRSRGNICGLDAGKAYFFGTSILNEIICRLLPLLFLRRLIVLTLFYLTVFHILFQPLLNGIDNHGLKHLHKACSYSLGTTVHGLILIQRFGHQIIEGGFR